MSRGLLSSRGLFLPLNGLSCLAAPSSAAKPSFFRPSHSWQFSSGQPLHAASSSPILEALQRFSLASRISRSPAPQKPSSSRRVPLPSSSQSHIPPRPTSSSPSPRPPRSSGGNGNGGSFLAFSNRYQTSLVVGGLILINIAVFLAWQYATYSWTDYKDPRPYLWMERNFLAGRPNLDGGRWWTLITCAFSQSHLDHFFLNMFTLTAMAPIVAQLIGPPALLCLYFGAGLSTSLTSILWHEARQSKGPHMSHGASGAVYSILTTFACLRPRMDLYLFFVMPVPAWLAMTGIFAWDFYQAVYEGGGKTDNAGHVGGVLTGLAYYFLRLRGRGI
ncbi:rhomboid-domain-containing protein [Jaminaea rosea]|uniref:Rhomboid-domain-containing protein n=1 Tax=Jaminaea rosea TaxID=1569628 RepID=A0A316UWA1_9BASI|nr:rhomboid-domain-containing protein [Jaminaea rosea]PWN29587.1 rhomboid-domain-containing protein [Jaminaea rosea]